MAIVSNVFWYINNKKWWVFEQASYTEILALGTAAQVIALLNTDPAGYYSALNTGWHLYNNYIANVAWTAAYSWSDGTVYYSNGTWAVEAPTYRTYTIVWNETSTPWSFFSSYQDDAAWMTQWSSAWDTIFWYSAVLLDDSWTEVAEITQSSAWILNLSSLWTLTGANNVMIKFPRRWIKMSKSGSQVTLSITTDPNKAGYTYYAFNRDGTAVDKFYVWAFKWTSSSSKLRSWATNATPTVSRSITDFRNTDVITWYWSSSHYSLITLPIRNYVNALYMMKYGNPDSQSVIGQGYTWWSAAQVLWTTVTWISWNSATWATNTSSTWRVRLFWLEDWRGNIYEWVDWIYWNYVNMTNNPSKLKELWNTSYWWESLWSATSISWNITSIVWNDKGMFFPSACSWSDYTTYYCDYGYVSASYVARAGGSWSSASDAGAFDLGVSSSATRTYASVGARLAYI